MSDEGTDLGHVHLQVDDLDRSVDFYTRFLDLELTEEVNGKKGRFAFLSAGDRHHDLALQATEAWARGSGGADPAPGDGSEAGKGSPAGNRRRLYHLAFEVPDRHALADTLFALRRGGVDATAVDHGISWAVYFRDPDGHAVEVYCDRRGAEDGRALWEGRSRLLSLREVLGPERVEELRERGTASDGDPEARPVEGEGPAGEDDGEVEEETDASRAPPSM